MYMVSWECVGVLGVLGVCGCGVGVGVVSWECGCGVCIGPVSCVFLGVDKEGWVHADL